MGKRQLHNLKRILAERIQALQENIDRSIHSLRKGGDSLPDPYDLAASESDTSMELTIRERDRALLVSLRQALARIERGRFGVCESCGGEIAMKRVLANPATTVCIVCKQQEETSGKRGALLPVVLDLREESAGR